MTGLRADGKVCGRLSHYNSTVDATSPLMVDPRVHDPIDGEPCEVKYRTIVVDPPWDYNDRMQSGNSGFGGKKRLRRGAANHYGTMSICQMEALPVGTWAEDAAHMYIWVTNSFVEDGFRLLRTWGFDYKTMLIWGKPQIGMGHYFRNNTEPILFGTRGNMATLRNDVPTLFMAPRGKHSEKPAAFYDMVETMSPGPYLDVFARKHRFNWDVYGNEVYSDIPLVGEAAQALCEGAESEG